MEITFTSGLTEVAQDLLKKKKENDVMTLPYSLKKKNQGYF